MYKSPLIACIVRPSMLGDCICSLPFLNYLHNFYPNSYKLAFIDRKCQSIVPFLLNQLLIDKILISEESDKITSEENKYFEKFDLVLEPFGHIVPENWYNCRHVYHQTFLLNNLRGYGYINPGEWNKLTKEEKIPRLNRWFDIKKNDNYIALWPVSGYSPDAPENKKRNPSLEYWLGLIDRLIKEGYKVAQLGLPATSLDERVLNLTHYSLFDSVKFSLGCLSISTDSGVSHLLASLGATHVCLSTYWRAGHIQCFSALLPINWNNSLLTFFDKTNINHIQYDKIIEGIKELNE